MSYRQTCVICPVDINSILREDKNTKDDEDNQETKRNKLVGQDFFYGILRLSAFLRPFMVVHGELTWNKQVFESNIVVSCMQMMS